MDQKFDPFEDRTVQQTVSKEIHETHPPIYFTAKSPGKCRWSIPASSRYWTDSRFDLKMVFQVFKSVNGKSEPLTVDDKIAPINLFLSSAFSNCSIFLNGVLVETYSNGLYPYCAYVKELMSKPEGYKKEILSTANGWYADTGPDWDDTDNLNDGFKKRSDLIRNSATVTFQGALSTDLSSCKLALSPGISIDVHLDHASNRFRLHGKIPIVKDKEIEYYVEFKSIDLILKRYLLKYVVF